VQKLFENIHLADINAETNNDLTKQPSPTKPTKDPSVGQVPVLLVQFAIVSQVEQRGDVSSSLKWFPHGTICGSFAA